MEQLLEDQTFAVPAFPSGALLEMHRHIELVIGDGMRRRDHANIHR